MTRLNEAQLRRMQESETPHLAMEAMRRLVEQKMREVTRHNVISRERFTARLEDLMLRYMREQLGSAEALAALFVLVAVSHGGVRIQPEGKDTRRRRLDPERTATSYEGRFVQLRPRRRAVPCDHRKFTDKRV